MILQRVTRLKLYLKMYIKNKFYEKIFLFVVLVLLTSCAENNKSRININSKTTIEKSSKNSISIEISDLPIQIDSTNYLLHPVGNFQFNNGGEIIHKSSKYRSDNFSVSNSVNDKIIGDLSNLKFQHLDSLNIKFLTKKTIKIRSITFLRELFNNTKKKILLYKVVDTDSNKNNKLDINDVNSLYLSKIDGTHFEKITDDKKLIDWKFIQSKNRLYFRTVENILNKTNFDKKMISYKYIDLSLNKIKIVEYTPY